MNESFTTLLIVIQIILVGARNIKSSPLNRQLILRGI